MGFGFNLGMIFIVMPLSIVLVITWVITKKTNFAIMLIIMWLAIIFLTTLSLISQAIFKKKILEKTDYYGEYTIDRNFFKGKQANWQYNHFRFEITSNDSIFFHLTDKQKIIKTFKGTISTVKPYSSERLIIRMQQPTHHIITKNPTIYRETWGFYMVFHSTFYNNMFFRKGKWKAIE